MKKLNVLFLVLVFAACLVAIEMPLRQAYDLDSSKLHIRTADGCEIVFWSDVPNGNRDIFAQKINSSGQLLWDEPIALVANPGDQRLLDVVPTSDNNFIILWGEYEIDTVSQLKMQKYTSNGQPLWLDGGVAVSGENIYIDTALLVPNSNGGAFMVFYSYDSPNVIKGQNLDSYGNQLWQAGGLSLFTHTDTVVLFEAIKDNEGGLIINIYQGTQYVNHLLRVNAEGLVIANPIFQASLFPGSYFHIKAFGTNQILLYDLGYFGISCTMAKIDYQGNLLTSVVTFPMTPSGQTEDYQLEIQADGGLVVAWSKDTSPKGLYLQMFDTNLAPVWQPDAIQIASSDNPIWNLSLSPAGDNIYISWNEGYNYEAYPPQFKAQMLNPQGISAWEAGGKVLGLGSEYNQSIAFSDRCLFLWNAPMEGKYKLQRQVVSSGGALYLPADGATIIQSLQGQAYALETYSLGDRFLTLWADSRRQQQKLYYQISNSNQQIQLPENGLALNPQENLTESMVSAVKTPDNCVAILYLVYVNSNSTCHLQLINNNGERLYSGRGLLIPISYYYTNLKLSCDATGIYLGWTKWEYGIGSTIMGQRISNGENMWGENGKEIHINTDTNLDVSLADLQGSYYIWREIGLLSNNAVINVLKVDINGDPAAGWDISGVSMISPEDSSYQLIVDSGLVGTDLVAFVMDMNYAATTKVQKINSSGVKLWSDTGTTIYPSDYSECNDLYDVVYDTPLSFIYGMLSQNMSQVTFQQISSDGLLMIQPTETIIVNHTMNWAGLKLERFANGSFIYAWSSSDDNLIESRNIYLRQISALGVPMGETPQVFCAARFQQEYLTMAIIGDKAMLAWSDDRAGILNSETGITGIWTNIYSSLPVALDDQFEVPSALPILLGNYPNPFNPSTTIGFTLPHAGNTSLEIFNLKGQLVKELYSNTDLALGEHSSVWDGKDNNGNPVSSGIYYYRLSFAGKSVNRKMVMLK
ncbi:MAG: FlgD immunoglobulin-like domain containing protein [Candidatus Cloacimonetes bacterium]|nr:FlgD immunoglobulin-like domain containing protein [Candidatus Cloacimonadota bacterium]